MNSGGSRSREYIFGEPATWAYRCQNIAGMIGASKLSRTYYPCMAESRVASKIRRRGLIHPGIPNHHEKAAALREQPL